MSKPPLPKGITQNHDHKYDLQLSQGIIDERGLAEIFAYCKIERVELKVETYKWERTGCVFIEEELGGKPSGISTTEADLWVIQLRGEEGELFGFFMFPVERLKRLCKAATAAGRGRDKAGDRGLSKGVLLKIDDLLAMIRQAPER